MLLFLLFPFALLTASQAVPAAPVSYSCISTSGTITGCPGNARPVSFTPTLAAFAKYVKRINQTGWEELEVVTNGALEDQVQAYYAGYLEGAITAPLIRSTMANILQLETKQWCTKLAPFIAENLNSVIKQVSAHAKTSPYWAEVGLTLYQVTGMDDGYAQGLQLDNHQNKPNLIIDPCGTMLLNLYTEFGNIQELLGQSVAPEERESRCSAIIKYLPATGDVMVGHNTWAGYASMLRTLKKYTLNYSTSVAKSIVMPSYPGNVFSTDDYYLSSAGLVIQETTNENQNLSLYKGLNASNIMFEFIRNTVANRLAANGSEWVRLFSLHNSGTYNNQFMIVDYKRLVGGKVQSGLLTVMEQLPSLIVSRDMSDHLRERGYWASYNVPFFPEIYKISGQEALARQDDFYSYSKTPRARIFARDQGKATNLTGLFHLLRYNDFTHDPLSRCNCSPPYTAQFALAERDDLNDPKGRYPIHDFTFRARGAIDAKMTNAKLAADLEMVAVSGPTDQTVPPFSWATTKLVGIPHADQPVKWNFTPVRTTWKNTATAFPDFKFDM